MSGKAAVNSASVWKGLFSARNSLRFTHTMHQWSLIRLSTLKWMGELAFSGETCIVLSECGPQYWRSPLDERWSVIKYLQNTSSCPWNQPSMNNPPLSVDLQINFSWVTVLYCVSFKRGDDYTYGQHFLQYTKWGNTIIKAITDLE